MERVFEFKTRDQVAHNSDEGLILQGVCKIGEDYAYLGYFGHEFSVMRGFKITVKIQYSYEKDSNYGKEGVSI